MISFDGGEYGVELSSALARHTDCEVRLVISRENAEPHLGAVDPSVDLVMYDRPRMRNVWSSLKTLRFIWHFIADYNPDVVHVQHHSFWLYLLLLRRIVKKYPTVVTVHDPVHHEGDKESQKTPQKIIHSGYIIADQLIVHASLSRRELTEKLQIPEEMIHVIPHIAVNNGGGPVEGLKEEENLVLFFGRIWDYKGLEYLIKSEPCVSKKIPEVQILIAGKGGDFSGYRSMMDNPERFVVHNAMVPWDVAAEYFTRASVVVLPYTDASSSGVIPVAYAFEKPVVATNVGGLPDMVDDGETGILVPPRDSEAIAHAIIRLLENPEMRHTMGKRGKQKLDRECGATVVATKTRRVYSKTIGDRKGLKAATME